MKAKKVLNILKVSRPTLCHYVKSEKLKVNLLPNGDYDYDDDSVYNLIGIKTREVAIYGRVSTSKQKNDLIRQLNDIRLFANKNGYQVTKEYSDVASGLSFDREDFKRLLFDVVNRKIKTVIISHKDRLARVSFDILKELFEYFDCKIIVINESDNDDDGIFNDIILLLHCFVTKIHSKRGKRKIEIIKDDLINEITE